jgi:hypothetical protein
MPPKLAPGTRTSPISKVLCRAVTEASMLKPGISIGGIVTSISVWMYQYRAPLSRSTVSAPSLFAPHSARP